MGQFIAGDRLTLAASILRPGDEVILCGELVYLTLDQRSPAMEDMIRQPNRPASFSVFGAQANLYSGISQSAAPIMRANPKVKFSLILDWYLHYLRGQKKDIVLVGGSGVDNGTNLEIIIWRNRRAVMVVDKHLPPVESSGFQAELEVALEDVYSRAGIDADLVPVRWCFPLEPLERYPSRYQFSQVLRNEFKRVRYKPAYLIVKKESPLAAWRLPAMTALAGLLVAAGQVAFEWHRYAGLGQEYDQEVAGYEEIYKQGASQLELLRSRDMLLQAEPQQRVLLNRWKRIVSALSKIEDAQVQRVMVFHITSTNAGLSASGRPTDFEIDVDVPPAPGVSHRVQAKRIMTDLARQTGYSYWLRASEVQPTANGARRFMMEGVSQ